jgi:hypothetical protein
MTRVSKRSRAVGLGALALFAGACSQQPPGAPTAIPELAGRTAGPPQDCVRIDPSTSLRIVDSRTMLYTVGNTVWLNRLATECPGADKFDIPVTHPLGDQYCRGDIVRANDPVSKIPGPSCVLGAFVPYRR